jgi:NhaP-type Na+/H+ or K+/H+ antiporter
MTVLLLLSYIPFLVAEELNFSGIVAILFTGIVSKHYTHKNLGGKEAEQSAEFMFYTLAYITETIVFLYLGECSWTVSAEKWLLGSNAQSIRWMNPFGAVGSCTGLDVFFVKDGYHPGLLITATIACLLGGLN